MRRSSRPGACPATVNSPLRMTAPSRWISHDFPTTKRSPCVERRAIAADEADAHVRWCFRQQFCRGVAETALIEDEEVEPSEVRCDQGELLAQRSLRQAQRRTYDEPVRLGVQEHERAKVAPTGKIEAGDMTGEHRRNVRDAAARQCGVRS